MENKITEIFKQAIIMEHRGKALYEKVSEQTNSDEVKKVFDIMAEEEQSHIEFLSKQFAYYKKNNKFDKNDFSSQKKQEAIAENILTKQIIEKISGSGFESAAISAAIDMENKSIEVYAKQAKETTDPNARELFEWLSNWEKGHLELLMDLNKQLTEKVWYDNNFWPF